MKNKILLIALLLLIPSLVLAQTAPASTNACTSATASIGRCVSQVYIWAMGAAGVLALIMIVFGGYITMTSAGNAQRASRGKEYIGSSLIGLALLFGAYILLNTINPDLTDFSKIDNCLSDRKSVV